MSRKPKTDYAMLKSLSKSLEKYARDNGLLCIKCSQYQWNVKDNIKGIILAVYPGSGMLWAAKLHYDHTGLIDKTSTKHYFTDEPSLIKKLDELVFAQDML